MSEVKLKRKLSSIADSKWGRAIVDRQWWEELEAPLGWKLASHCGRSTAEFFTIYFGDGVWDGLSIVTAGMRDSIMLALGHEGVGSGRARARDGAMPLAPVVDFPSHN